MLMTRDLKHTSALLAVLDAYRLDLDDDPSADELHALCVETDPARLMSWVDAQEAHGLNVSRLRAAVADYVEEISR